MATAEGTKIKAPRKAGELTKAEEKRETDKRVADLMEKYQGHEIEQPFAEDGIFDVMWFDNVPLAGVAKNGVITLTLKATPFLDIAEGRKVVEYRDASPYYHNMFWMKDVREIVFRNGRAGKDVPTLRCEVRGVWLDTETMVFEIHLGEILKVSGLDVVRARAERARAKRGDDEGDDE